MSGLFFDDDHDEHTGDEGEFTTADINAEDKIPARTPGKLFGLYEHEQRFLNLINENRLPHALVFHGPKGVGKYTTAVRLARTLIGAARDASFSNTVDGTGDNTVDMFGAAPPSRNILTKFDIPDMHPDAQRIMAGSHPDLLIVGGQGEDDVQSKSGAILIDQARKVPAFLRLKSSIEGGWRVVIIDNADRLNRNAQNALLKILEEPPTRTVLILVTHHLGHLLPTIRSRTQTIRFMSLNDADFDAWLKAQDQPVSSDEKAWLQILAKNAPGQAQAMLDLNVHEQIRNFLGLWNDLSTFDEQRWTDYTETLALTDSDTYEFALNFWLWWMDAIIRAKTDPAYANELEKLTKSSATLNFVKNRTLGFLLESRDQIRTLFERTMAASLEKRQALFSARMWMMDAA